MIHIGRSLALDLLLLGVGEGCLFAVGLVRSPRQALRWAGLAFVVGWCVLGAVIVYALILGLLPTVWELVAIAAALVVAAVSLGRVVPAAADRAVGPERGLAEIAALAALACLVGYLALLGLHAAVTATPKAWDAWAFWLPRAKAIFFFHGLHPHLRGGFASFTSPEYPPLVPAFDAVVFGFAGSAAVLALPFQDWLLAAAFVAAAAAVLRQRVRPALVWPSLCLLVLTPQFGAGVGDGHADPQLARLVGLAAVCGGVWLLERDGRLLAIAGILLVGAVLTKREGLLLGLLLALALAVAARSDGGARGWWRPLGLAPTLVVAALPWQIWLHVEHVKYSPDYTLRSLLHPVFLAQRLDRLGIALERLPRVALSFDHWLLVLPLALLLAVLAARTSSGLAVLVLGLVFLDIVGLAGVYWIGKLPVTWWMSGSASRVIVSPVFVAGLLTPLLGAELLRTERPAYAAPPTRRVASGPIRGD